MSEEHRVKERLSAGDPGGAATEAIRALGPAIFRYLRSLLRDESDAADAFSDFAETLWQSLPSFRGEASLRTWAYRIAWTCARSVREQPWKRRGRLFHSGEASRIAQEVRTNSAVVWEQKRRALDELRATLAPEDQSLLILRIDQQLSWKEIAGILSETGSPIQPAALMKRFERLKSRLARLAMERGLLK